MESTINSKEPEAIEEKASKDTSQKSVDESAITTINRLQNEFESKVQAVSRRELFPSKTYTDEDLEDLIDLANTVAKNVKAYSHTSKARNEYEAYTDLLEPNRVSAAASELLNLRKLLKSK